MPENSYMYIALFFAGYLAGSVPWAFIIGKINGIDIRKHGSGNVGATNVRRTLGKKWGITCFFLDLLKGFLPVLMIKLISKDILSETGIGVVIVSIASVSGHMWPIFLRFKGGKGISTIAGIVLAIAPLSLLSSGLIWALLFYTTRFVSLASITAAVSLPIFSFAFTYFNIGGKIEFPELIMLTFLAMLAIFRHRGNIKRLLNGTESRFVKKKGRESLSERISYENSSTE